MWSVCDLLRLLSIFVLSSYYGRSQTHGSGLDSCGDSFSCSVANDTLNFLFMSSSDAQFNNSGSFVAAKIAVEQVNAAQDVLQGYSLEISSRRDSEVSCLNACLGSLQTLQLLHIYTSVTWYGVSSPAWIWL